MKEKFGILFFVFSFFSLYAFTQSEKVDSVKPARQIILKNSGEKNLPQQLKENQLKEQPVILNSDSLNIAKANIKRTKTSCNKHSKKKRS